MNTTRIIVGLSALWSAISLAYQVYAAWGGGRHNFSRRAGSPAKGLAYNFTVAMTPAHKESVRKHPVAFVLGLLMHAGANLTLLLVLLLLVWPDSTARTLTLLRPLLVIALAAGIVLFVKRTKSANLRAMSAPDDYFAMLATCGLLICAIFHDAGAAGRYTLLVYTAAFFVYLPLGKLRHAVFFFAARGEYGRRLGYRGVYPPAATEVE